MIKASVTAVILVLFFYTIPVNAQHPGDPPRERLGVRVSFTGTAGQLKNHFGHGYDFTLYFTERIYRPLYLEIGIGATYLGDVFQGDLGADFLREALQVIIVPGTDVASEMRLAYLTLGPQYTWPVSETHTWYGSLSLGIYSVSMVFDTGVQAFDLSDQNFGFNGGTGLLWRITENWNLEVNATLHKIWTENRDLYYIFTEGSQNPWMLGIGLGLALDLR
jgi:opacity protein-like surface antigen